MNNHYLLVEILLLIFPRALTLACYENDKKDRAPDFGNDMEAGYCDGQLFCHKRCRSIIYPVL